MEQLLTFEKKNLEKENRLNSSLLEEFEKINQTNKQLVEERDGALKEIEQIV